MRTTLALMLALATLGSCEFAAAQSEPLEIRLTSSRDGVVVLKTGRTLRGEVVRLGDQLQILLPGGGEIRVSMAQALVVAESLEEAYAMRRDALSRTQIDDRAKLAEWCLQEGLLHRAADQVLALSKIDPRHPKLPHLERRLLARAKESVRTRDDESALPDDAGAVSTAVGFEEMPAVDPRTFFVDRVQSQAMFGCGAARCHGGTTSREFKLRTFPIAVKPTDDVTDANYQALRKIVGDGSPASPAMRYATRAHAGAAGERVRELLAEWSRHLAAESGGSLASTAGYSASAGSGTASGRSAIRTAAYADGDASPTASSSDASNPYDPAEFNRRYHGSRVLPPPPR